MKRSTNATTLFDLKEEYLKAKQKTFQAGLSEQHGNKSKNLRAIIQYGKKEKEENERKRKLKQHKTSAKLALTEKEREDLAKSQGILEAKSRLYDKLKGVDNDELTKRCLVDFSQKEYEEKDDRDEPDIMDYNEARNYDYESEEPMSSTHFSHVDHGEVRSKGVGFYTFSQDSETRRQQMEFLDSMRESTERSREIFIEQRKARDKDKLNWLNRIRKKRNMPLWETLPNAKPDSEFVEDDVPEKEENIPEKKRVDIEEMFIKKDKSLWEKRVDALRDERIQDFAPTYDGPIEEESDEILNFISMVRRQT